MNAQPTRRDLMASGIAAAAAGAVLPAAAAASVGTPASDDAQTLMRTLEVEQLVVVAYRQALASGVLTPAMHTELRLLLGQELQHVAALRRALRRNGGAPPPAPSLAEAQTTLTRHQIHWSLTRLRNQHACLKLLVDVESLAENAYFKAISLLQDPVLVRRSAQIMGCEAQHWTVLSGLLNHFDVAKAVPYPFVEGSP
jgi:Ferritin-like domain